MTFSVFSRKNAQRAAQVLTAAALVGYYSLQAQTPSGIGSQSTAKKPVPNFNAAGIQGNIAPSGYSDGAREEETRQVASLAVDLQAANFADELPAGQMLGCERQPELLHAVLTHPEDYEANMQLGLFYLQHRNARLGVKYLSAAREKHPADAAVVRYLAMAEIEAGDYSDAGQLVPQWLDAHPDDAIAHRLRGSIEAAAGRSQAALAEYRLSIHLDPSENNTFSAGFSIMTLGFFAEADDIFANATKDHPGSGKLWLAAGMVDALRSHQREAIDSLLRSVALDPKNPLAPTLLATLAGSAEAKDRILPAVHTFATANPGEAIAHYDYALVLSKISPGASDAPVDGQIQSELKTAIREQPQFAAAHYQLGIVYETAGNTKSAIDELAQAIHLEPDVAAWHYRLARAYRKAGQIPSADTEMQSFERLKAKRDAGEDVSAKLLEGLSSDLIGVGIVRCEATSANVLP